MVSERFPEALEGKQHRHRPAYAEHRGRDHQGYHQCDQNYDQNYDHRCQIHAHDCVNFDHPRRS